MNPLVSNTSHSLSLNILTPKQRFMIKGPIVNIDNRFNEVFSLFNPFNKEFSLDSYLIDIFHSCFSFHYFNKQSDQNIKSHICFLNNITIKSSSDPSYALVISDASIKNNIATSISHIHVHDKPAIKTIHHVVNIITTEVELFAIRYSINQATALSSITNIVVLTDSIHAARRIFDSSLYFFQIHIAAILAELRIFFSKNHDNSIEFWECSSHYKWPLHEIVNEETKQFHLCLQYPYKSSWDFSKKNECNNIFSLWKITFQALDEKGNHFLKLLDNDNKLLEPIYSKNRTWLKYFGHSNFLCMRATRAIVKHASIGEYRLRFFPREDFKCLCGNYPIKTRHHILYNCKRYNEYWNPRRDTISYFTLFLEYNNSASFRENIT